jgi:RHS repeat-associated protein
METQDANKNKTSEGFGGTISGYGFTSAGTTYDDEDRLTGYARTNGTFTQSWNLTKVGDWTSVTTNGTAQNRTHGPTHGLLTAGGQSLATDPKGNITLLSLNLTPQSSPLALQWDFDNKLRSADLGNNSSVDVNFQYDALGRRVARTGTGGSVVYVQHDQQTIADYPVGGVATTPTNRYVYASYIDEPVVRKAAGTSGTIHYYHRNQQYSITAMTTSSGAVAERYAYTAYGQPTILNASGTVLTSSAVGNRYTYTGREWDETLGLHHFRARWMSPLAGRFLGRDPIGYSGSEWALYEFLHSNSQKLLDPSGLECHIDLLATDVAYVQNAPGQPLKGLWEEFDSKTESDWDGIPFFGIDWWDSTSSWGAQVDPDGQFLVNTKNETSYLDGGWGNDGGGLGDGKGQADSEVVVNCNFTCDYVNGDCYARVNCSMDPSNGKDEGEFAGSKSVSLATYTVVANGPVATVTINTQSFWIRNGIGFGLGVGPTELPLKLQNEIIAADLPKDKFASFKCTCPKK